MNELSSLSEIRTTEIGAKSPESGSKLREERSFISDLCSKASEISKPITDVIKEVKNDLEGWGGKYVDKKERLDQCPQERDDRGKWEGERGNSKFIPSGETGSGKLVLDKLGEYGLDGIEYNNLEPDFSKCSEGTIEIDQMTSECSINFPQADQKLSEQWNKELRDGRNDWTAKEVRDYRKENALSWHERCDMKTMDLVQRDIHKCFTHSGGRAECKTYAGKEVKFGWVK